MDGFDRPWWIIGGWAIEAFTGVPRKHEDLRLFLRDRYTPWNMDHHWLRPFDDMFHDIPVDPGTLTSAMDPRRAAQLKDSRPVDPFRCPQPAGTSRSMLQR